MWFTNSRIYRFTQPFTTDAESLSHALSESVFVPCGSQDMNRYGWVSPIYHQTDGDEPLVHSCQGNLLLCAKKQEKVLPAAVIKEAVEEKIAVITESEGRPVSRKERQSLKDDVLMELLPKAFTRSNVQYAYIAPDKGYIVINAASASKAEELLSALRDAVGSLPVVPLVSKQLPYQVMTRWLNEGDIPATFSIGDECELSDPKASGSVIRCKHQDLSSDEIKSLLEAGMIVTKLGVTWKQGVDFILDDQLVIKRLRFEDNIHERVDALEPQDKAEQFDATFSVMAIELSALIEDLMSAFGGINTQDVSVDEIVAAATQDDQYLDVDEVAFT